MKNYFLLYVFVFLSLFVVGQIDATNFDSHFNDETEHEIMRTNHSSMYHRNVPERIPEWILNLPVGGDNYAYSIGISDPAMDSVDAIHFATKRALMMAALFNSSMTQLLCDFFLDEGEHASNVVYENYAQIISRLPIDMDSMEVVHSTYNSFNEAMVLVKYPLFIHADTTKSHKVVIDVYKNEVEHSLNGDFESIYELSLGSELKDSPFLQYQVTELGPRSNVSGVIDTVSYELPIYTLKYQTLHDDDTAGVNYFTHGLWKEYFKSVTNQIVANARKKPENIKVLADKYQLDSYQKMTRGISKNIQSFNLDKIVVEKNVLRVNLLEVNMEE